MLSQHFSNMSALHFGIATRFDIEMYWRLCYHCFINLRDYNDMDLLIDIYTIFELIYIAFFIICLGLSQFGENIGIRFSKKFRIVF